MQKVYTSFWHKRASLRPNIFVFCCRDCVCHLVGVKEYPCSFFPAAGAGIIAQQTSSSIYVCEVACTYGPHMCMLLPTASVMLLDRIPSISTLDALQQ